MAITEAPPAIRVVQQRRTEEDVVRHARPEATPAEVTASTCSCVVHLCGCENPA